MTSDNKQQALALITEIQDLAPEIRLGQLFAHLGFLSEIHVGKALGYVDDDELLAVLYRHRAELLNLLQGHPTSSLPQASSDYSVSGSSTTPAQTPAS